MKRRTALETKERQVQKLKNSIEKNTGSVVSGEKLRELEKYVEREIMPGTSYENRGREEGTIRL